MKLIGVRGFLYMSVTARSATRILGARVRPADDDRQQSILVM